MSEHGFHVHGPHDHAPEHESHAEPHGLRRLKGRRLQVGIDALSAIGVAVGVLARLHI